MVRSIIRSLALGAVLAGTAGAQVVNGGFEASPPAGAGSFATYGVGQTFNGWTVSAGSIDLINNYWNANGGTYSVDMNGNSTGGIFQNVLTSVGSTYSLSFALAGNPDGGPTVKSMDVYWGGNNVGSVTFDASNASHANMGWQTFTMANLVATSASTRLEFVSTSGGSSPYYGAALDDVALSTTATPEPATFALMASGLALVGAAARRRRTVTA
jgi:choice-of-anchor C domain-containing protein